MPSADELVQSCTLIFTLPDMYFRVRDVVDDPKATTDDLVNAIKFDPAMSARLLRIVNSPLYGFAKQIDTLTRAVTLLGMQAVNDLVMATTVGRTFSGMTMQLMDMPMFWRNSVLCALLAGRIAKSCGIDDSERFFIEGLLRDIGHLVLYQTVPQRAQSALVEAGYLGASLAEVEQPASDATLLRWAPSSFDPGGCPRRLSGRSGINCAPAKLANSRCMRPCCT